jgi:hypothetical protein
MDNIYFEFLPFELIDIILFKLGDIDDIEHIYKIFTFDYTEYNKFIKLWVNYKLRSNDNFNLLLSLINKDNINWDKLYREFIIIKDLNIDKVLSLNKNDILYEEYLLSLDKNLTSVKPIVVGIYDRTIFSYYLNKLPIDKKDIWNLFFLIVLNKCKYLIELLSENEDFMTFISIPVFGF